MTVTSLTLRPATPADFPAILALNTAVEHLTSPLGEERLAALHAQAALHLVAEHGGRVVAFLLALREGADYNSPNFQWFRARYPAFLYVDRVVVDAAERGLGLGRRLYDALIAHGRASGAPLLCCEFDLDPPNPPSMRFHDAYGFTEAGRQALYGGKKEVSLQVLDLSPT